MVDSRELSIEEAVDLALQYHQAGQLAEAERLYRQVLQAKPDHADALHYLGVIAHQREDPKTAIDLIGKAIRHSPGNAPYHSNLGEAYRALGHLEEAAGAYRQALDIDPNFAMAHNNLANVLADAGDKVQALECYDRAIHLLPDDPEIQFNRANHLIQLRRFDDAIAGYRRLLEKFPSFPVAWNALGTVLEATGRLEDATKAFRQVLDLAPNFDEARTNLDRVGWMSVQADMAAGDKERAQSNWDAASAAYERVIEHQSDHAAAHYGVGLCREAQGLTNEAIRAFDCAARIQPFFEDAHAGLGRLLLKQSDCGVVGTDLLPKDREPAAHTAVAIAHFRAERFAQAEHSAQLAVNELGEILNKRPDDNEAWTLLGLALRAIRDVAKSERLLRAQLAALNL